MSRRVFSPCRAGVPLAVSAACPAGVVVRDRSTRATAPRTASSSSPTGPCLDGAAVSGRRRLPSLALARLVAPRERARRGCWLTPASLRAPAQDDRRARRDQWRVTIVTRVTATATTRLL